MKVPKYIKKAIRKCSYHNTIAANNENIVRNWLDKNKLSDETYEQLENNMTDSFIDCCTYINDNAEEFIKQLEELKMEVKR